MQWLSPLLLTIQVVSSLAIIVLVLLQQGKGADMGSAFGSGSAGSLFGASGAANFLSRTTKWAAIVFFATTGGLAYMAHHPSTSPLDAGVMKGFKQEAPAPAPKPATGPAVPSVPGSAPAPEAPTKAAPASNVAVPSVPAAPAANDKSPSAASPAAAPAATPSADNKAPSQPAGDNGKKTDSSTPAK